MGGSRWPTAKEEQRQREQLVSDDARERLHAHEATLAAIAEEQAVESQRATEVERAHAADERRITAALQATTKAAAGAARILENARASRRENHVARAREANAKKAADRDLARIKCPLCRGPMNRDHVCDD
jgi:hypothetical protein